MNVGLARERWGAFGGRIHDQVAASGGLWHASGWQQLDFTFDAAFSTHMAEPLSVSIAGRSFPAAGVLCSLILGGRGPAHCMHAVTQAFSNSTRPHRLRHVKHQLDAVKCERGLLVYQDLSGSPCI